MRCFIKPLVVLCVMLAMMDRACAADRPNVLFIFTDDQRADTIAALGAAHIKTPNLDRLVRAGLSFNRAYMQGGFHGATCVPSRAMLLSGQSLFRIDEKLMRDETWPAAFGRAGYTTFMCGKWHNGAASIPRSFQIARSVFVGGMTDPMKAKLSDVNGDGKLTAPKMSDKHACAVFADEAIRFLKDHKSGPFFCYVPFDGPHDPHVVPDDFPIQYDAGAIHLPRNFLPQHAWDNGEMTVRDEQLLPWPRTPEKVRAMNAAYHRYISYLDAQIGRVLDALEASPHAKNTIIVFASDSGVARGSHGLIGKQNLYEHSVRVPLIIGGPGIAANKTTDAMCHLFDVLPTLGKLCGVTGPATSQGLDLGATLSDPSKPARTQLMFAYRNVQRAIRDERWKLIRYPQIDRTQLFDLQNDPDEMINLADNPDHAAKVVEMMALLEKEQAHFGDKQPLNVANPKPADWAPPAKGAARENAAPAPPLAPPRPNVVIFLADDAGWGDYSRNGNTLVRTPNIDSLATSGVTLDRFFVCPVCSPTRAEFLTGRYHPRTGVNGVSTGRERLNLDEKTIADAFKAAGYATGAFGKWHNGSQWPYHPMARGFDEYHGHSSGHWGEYFDPPLEHNGAAVRDKGYIVDACTDQAIDFIGRNKSKPFFCFVPFTTPHSPFAVPEPYWRRFKDKPIPQKASVPAREVEDQTRCALAMLENQDDNVGRVLRKLDEIGATDNTIVIYFSDNGPNTARWNGGMKGIKAGTDEGGVRAPMFMRWPGKLRAGHVVPQIAAAIDLLPTLAALTGIGRVGDKPLDGRDLTPLLMDKAAGWPERMIFSTWGGNISVRTQSHRLDSAGKLFDMTTDPGQAAPVNDKNPELVKSLTDAVAAWRKEMFGDGPAAEIREKIKSVANAVDPRPIPVGYREFPRTWLPARDGEPRGAVRRSSSAPNCSYFVNWTSKDDALVWEVEVATTGDYTVEISYTCPLADAGSNIELTFNGTKLAGKVETGWDPPLYTNQDTIPRPPGESKMKEFHLLNLGKIHLEKGRGPLVLRATEIPGAHVMDLRAITLTLQP